MPSRLKDLRLETRFPYDDQDFREKYTPGHVSPSSLKYTGDESKGPRAANASLKNNHPVFIFSHHDSDGSQNLFLCEEKNVSFRTFYRQTLALPSREHPLNPAYLCSLAFGVMTRRIAKGTQWPVAVASPFKFQNSTLISYARNVTRVRIFPLWGRTFFS